MAIIDCHVYMEGNVLPGVNQNGAQLGALLQSRGIDRAVVQSARAALVDPLTGNRILKATLDQHPNLYGCLVAHLNRVDASLQTVKDLLGSRNFVGVLLTGTNPAEPLHPLLADEILNACRRYQKPVLLHTPNAACVEVNLQIAKTYNMHKFVFLGMGGADWRNGIAAAHQSVNIFLETSGALDRAKIAAAVEVVGPHRVLFGSSLPTLDPAAALGLVKDATITATEQRRILYDNAYRLFNLADLEA
jgi:predicted TIM-barrel fold metal-dependent hydrolase